MNKIYVIAGFIIGQATLLVADQITIANKTGKPLYAAFYYTKGVTSERMKNKDIMPLAVDQTLSVERPDLKIYFGAPMTAIFIFRMIKLIFPM